MYIYRQVPLVPYALRLISLQVNDSQHKDQHSSTYARLYRDWDKRNEAGWTKAHKPGSNQTQNQTGSMLQRWQQESMLDQPYHNLEAVKRRVDLENSKQVKYFDPHDKTE